MRRPGCKGGPISFELWVLLIGGLLLIMSLAQPLVRRAPLTSAMIYLLIGVAVGPWWLGFLDLDPMAEVAWLHRASEISVIISLFTVGLKLRLSVWDRRLRPALSLAFLSMLLTVGLVTLAGVWWLGLPLGAAILLGAVLSPTDPVLASDVQTKDAHDQDKIRLTLTAEGGMNDGTAFPFVMLGLGLLGLHDVGEHFLRWWLVDVAWAVVAGLALGGGLGYGVGKFVLRLNARQGKVAAVGEYLLLGLIGVSYGLALQVHAYGFLAVFAAGLGLRAAERAATASGKPRQLVNEGALGTEGQKAQAPKPASEPAYFTGALLTMNEQIERILEVALVLVVGAGLMLAGLAPEAWWFVPLLFLIIRPLATVPILGFARFTPFEFSLLAWFGIRGIGSIYYLMYAVAHGLSDETSQRLISLTFTVIAASILVHGMTATPLLKRYARTRR